MSQCNLTRNEYKFENQILDFGFDLTQLHAVVVAHRANQRLGYSHVAFALAHAVAELESTNKN